MESRSPGGGVPAATRLRGRRWRGHTCLAREVRVLLPTLTRCATYVARYFGVAFPHLSEEVTLGDIRVCGGIWCRSHGARYVKRTGQDVAPY